MSIGNFLFYKNFFDGVELGRVGADMERGKACADIYSLKREGFDGLSASVFMGISVDIHFWPADGVKRAFFVRLCITKTNFRARPGRQLRSLPCGEEEAGASGLGSPSPHPPK